jgi:valyl-tRNA synthetase
MDEEWEQKVSDVAKDTEKNKLKDAETEARNWQASIEQFEKLKLE